MKLHSALLLCLLLMLTVANATETNLLVGTVGDYGLTSIASNRVTLTLLSPNPRVVNNVQVRQDPIDAYTETNGAYYFTNIQWGKYRVEIAGRPAPTPFTLYVGTNTSGTVAIGSLITNSAALPPNPASNYYTMSQVDALISSGGGGISGAVTNYEQREITYGNGLNITNGPVMFGSGGTAAAIYPFDGSAVFGAANSGGLTILDGGGIISEANALFLGAGSNYLGGTTRIASLVGAVSLSDATNAATTVVNTSAVLNNSGTSTNQTNIVGNVRVDPIPNYGGDGITFFNYRPTQNDNWTNGTGSKGVAWSVSSTSGNIGDYFDAWLNPLHGGGSYASVPGSEMQVSMGGNLALAVGYLQSVSRHIQWGIGTANMHGASGSSYAPWSYGQSSSPYDGHPGYSWLWAGRCADTTYGLDKYPGWNTMTYTNDPNGAGKGIGYSFDIIYDSQVANSSYADTHDPDIYITALKALSYTNGLRLLNFRGGRLEQMASSTTTTTNVLLDFANAAARVVNVTAGQVVFSTTNSLAGYRTNFDSRQFYIRSGATTVTNVVFSKGITLLTNIPFTSLAAGCYAKIQVDSVGQGETNKIVSVLGVGLDNTFSWDSDATNFFARAAITDDRQKAAVNQFVLDLKSYNLWTKRVAGWPFIGGTSNSCSQNLFYSSNSITFTSSGVTYDANGITGNGSSGYGDTGFNPLTGLADTNSVSIYLYNKTAIPSGYLFGANLSGKYLQIWYNTALSYIVGRMNNTGTATGTGAGDQRFGFCFVKTNATTQLEYKNGAYAVSEAITAGTPGVSMFVCARNSDGVPSNYSTNTIGGVFMFTGLTAGENANLHTAVTSFMTARGIQNP